MGKTKENDKLFLNQDADPKNLNIQIKIHSFKK